MKASGVYYLIRRYAYDARLRDVTLHALRHTFGKNLVDAGVPLQRAAQLLGHESIDTTRIYTAPSEQDLQRKVASVWMRTPQHQAEAKDGGRCSV